MAIVINGSGTLTGVSVGGLPDGIVDTDMLATSAVATAKIADDAVSAAKIGTKSFVSYAVICDQKAQNTAGGGFTSGAWRTRDLNTEIFDPDGIVSISSNQFTLSAGNYYIEWSCPGHGIDQNQSRLQDITGAATIQAGTSEFCSSSGGAFEQTRSFGSSRVSITSNNVYEIQHRGTTTKAGNGFGVCSNFTVEIYTIVKIFREA